MKLPILSVVTLSVSAMGFLENSGKEFHSYCVIEREIKIESVLKRLSRHQVGCKNQKKEEPDSVENVHIQLFNALN